MREKTIYEGEIEGEYASIQKDIDMYFSELISHMPKLELNFDTIGSKIVWIVTPENSANKNKIINGYIELNPVALAADSFTYMRIVSCREELDLFYFQLSVRIQSKYLLPYLSFYGATIPWEELVEKGYIFPPKKEALDIIYSPLDPDETAKKYGTNGRLTKNDIRRAVKACEEWQKRGGSVRTFYTDSGHSITNECEYDTFVRYAKNPTYKSKKDT